MTRLAACVALGIAVAACGDGGGGGDDTGSTTAAPEEPLEIIGLWVDETGAEHDIDDGRWVQTFQPDVYTYFIQYFDNDAQYVVTRTPNDQTYARFEWAWVGEQLYYCPSATGQVTAVAAETAPKADATDPTTGGCLGAAWTRMDPA